MGSYQIPTTAVEDAALRVLAAKDNQLRGVEGLPPLAPEDWFRQQVARMLQAYSDLATLDLLGEAARAYPSLSAEDRGRILTLLGRPAFAVLPLPDQVEALYALVVERFRQLDPAQQAEILTLLGIG